MSRRAWKIAALALVAVAAAIRVNNAFRYSIGLGFDAEANWDYISGLATSWALPHPEAGFTTGHAPLFYYAAAGLRRLLGSPDMVPTIISTRLASSALGLVAIGAAVALVRRADPENPRRAWLAAALLVFLPAHIYMSAMLSEEIMASSLTSLALVGLCFHLMRGPDLRRSLWPAAVVGLMAGLAWLTKLSGVMVLAVAVGVYAVAGWQRGWRKAGLQRAALAGGVGLVVGGWFFANNWIQYGYLYPQGLEVHRVMMDWPPGERRIWDYLYVPLATWLDPRVVQADLLRSVWGGTYITLWFDGHMHYLPRYETAATALGRAILALALLPTAAFAVGLARGVGRALRARELPDTAFVSLVGITLAGYAFFTWRNPWFPTVKGSYLLGLSVPFAYYASEVLDAWVASRWRWLIWAGLGALFAAVAVTFTFGLVFAKAERPGFG